MYWFTKGWNARAVIAWAIGSVVGLLCSSTTIFTGPLAGIADGVDLSFVAGMLAAAVSYLAIRGLFPETRPAQPNASIARMRLAASKAATL